MIINPLLIDKRNDAILLKKVSEKDAFYSEGWLQNIIDTHPSVIPITDDFNANTEIISLGREIFCGSGYIDNLLLNSNAELIIIETKLWKNPEQSRTVIAQVIDYAKEIKDWSINDLDKAIQNDHKKTISTVSGSLGELITMGFVSIEENEFLNQLQRNLEEGNIHLIIAGDKISPNLVLLSDSLQSSPGLNFRLLLIELKMYEYKEDIIIIPDIVGRTKEVIRGVVKVQYSDKKKPVVDVTLTDDNKRSSKDKTDKSTFLSQCPPDIATELDRFLSSCEKNQKLLVNWGVKGLSIRKYTNDKLTTILDIFPDCISLVIESLAQACDIPDAIYIAYLTEIKKVEGISSFLYQKKRYLYYDTISLDEFKTILGATSELIETLNTRNLL